MVTFSGISWLIMTLSNQLTEVTQVLTAFSNGKVHTGFHWEFAHLSRGHPFLSPVAMKLRKGDKEIISVGSQKTPFKWNRVKQYCSFTSLKVISMQVFNGTRLMVDLCIHSMIFFLMVHFPKVGWKVFFKLVSLYQGEIAQSPIDVNYRISKDLGHFWLCYIRI